MHQKDKQGCCWRCRWWAKLKSWRSSKLPTGTQWRLLCVILKIWSVWCIDVRTSPGSDVLHNLQKKFEEYDVDDDITFSQWDSTDGTTLRTCTTPAKDFLEQLAHKIDKFTTHSFIAKSQACYLKTRKAKMDDTACLILLDFSENYHYVVQDEVQAYHWNKEQCTLHPVVLHYKTKCSAPPCVSCLMIWNMILLLSLNCNDRPVCTSKRRYQMWLFWNTSDGCCGQY